MAIIKASNEIGKLYKGSNQIGKAYKGSILLYQAEMPLYSNGTQDVAWVGQGGGYGDGQVTFRTSDVELKATGIYGSGSRRQAMITSKKIDLTTWNTIRVVVSGYDGYLRYTEIDNFILGLTSAPTAIIYETAAFKVNLNPPSLTKEKREVIIDISSVSGEYHIGIGLAAYKMYDYTDTAYVYSVILE